MVSKQQKTLYELTGDIKDANTVLINRMELSRLRTINTELMEALQEASDLLQVFIDSQPPYDEAEGDMVSKQPEAEIPASVPPGWKLVPATLTEAQKSAAQNAWWEASSAELYWERIYQVMLAAAPQPPVVEQEPVAEVIVSHTRAGLNGQYTAEIESRERLPVGAELFIRPQPRQPQGKNNA